MVPPFFQSDVIITTGVSIVEWGFVVCSLYNLVKCYTTEPGNLPFKEIETPLEADVQKHIIKLYLRSMARKLL